jgi:predicted phage tail protein
MNKSWIIGAVLMLLSIGVTNAQDTKESKKARKEEKVINAKEAIAHDKAELNTLRERKADDKYLGDKVGVKADRKAILKTDKQLMKHRAKRDIAKVKKVI